jgi:hypothetical protein
LLFTRAIIKIKSERKKGVRKGGTMQVDHSKPKRFVWVTDNVGNKYLCPVDTLKDPKHATEEELKNCIDDATMAIDIGD